jgi:8-oxo-dGTP pyrophosphatase MutT (NUDIX family)
MALAARHRIWTHPRWGQMPPDTIADAASVIVLRGAGANAQVLMGQRGARAAFMPRKFVFPGGQVDAGDFHIGLPDLLAPTCRAALTAHVADGPAPHALTAAALRELQEETGLHLARHRPAALRFVFRAITPIGPPRRFDARFFLAQSDDFAGDMNGFSAASGELALLQWLTLPQARALDLPFITRVILAELHSTLSQGADFAPQGVPFFDNTSAMPRFLRL